MKFDLIIQILIKYMHAIHTRLASLPLAPVRVVSEDMKCVGGGGPLLLLRPRRGLGAGGGPGLGPSCLLASSSRRKLGNSYLAGGGNPGSRDNTLSGGTVYLFFINVLIGPIFHT